MAFLRPALNQAQPRRLPTVDLALLILLGMIAAPNTARHAQAAEPSPRHYAPEHQFDLTHLHLDITPDFDQRTIAGTATLSLKPLVRPLQELTLDAVDLRLESVVSEPPLRAWNQEDERIVITLANPALPDQEIIVTIRYSAEPQQGLYFRTPDQGYRQGETHLFTQGEPESHRYWFPGFDSPNERFTSELICHVPNGMVALSNGTMLSRTRDAQPGLTSFHWRQEQTHVNYLIALVAGYFQKIEQHHGDLPLAFYVPPSEIDQAANSFAGTVEMMRFFEAEIGVPYPWDRYDQICVNDFVAGGMENTTLTILTDRTLFTPATETIRSSEGLVAHELAHQWFGDLLTCKDWSHIWLNESFATYYQTLFAGHQHGRDELIYQLYERRRSLLKRTSDTRAIVRRTFTRPDDMFNHLTYPKGGWVLHMLRSQLGPNLYRQCIQAYVERHRFDNVVTEDLVSILEELSGRSWDRFFDQWIYHGGYPQLEISYHWNELQSQAKLTIKQVQKLDDNVLLFHLPLTIHFQSDTYATDHELVVRRTEEDFTFTLPSAPAIVSVDPQLSLLAKLDVQLPKPLIEAQLQDADNLANRLTALEHFGKRRDAAAVGLLQETLNHDPFYGVRIHASRALRSIHSPTARQALLSSLEQPDARVRQQVVSDLGQFYSDDILTALLDIIESEPNPAIVASAIEGLRGYPSRETLPVLKRQLQTDTYHDTLTLAALRTGRRSEDPAFVDLVLELLQQRKSQLASPAYAEALKTLAHLSRNQDDRTNIRELLAEAVTHPRQRVRLAAIEALGNLGDPQAIPVLDRFTDSSGPQSERQTAERAVKRLREQPTTSPDIQQLRQDLLDLRKEHDTLREQVESLEKR